MEGGLSILFWSLRSRLLEPRTFWWQWVLFGIIFNVRSVHGVPAPCWGMEIGNQVFEPSYLATQRSGDLGEKVHAARDLLRSCRICPRECEVDRLAGERGDCNTGFLPMISSYNPHFGEEPCLTGSRGSGTIFFTSCNLRCVFCQNYEISHQMEGREVSPQALASMMLDLQERGCHNINFVTPSHMVAQILEALPAAIARGLRIPLVYNTSAYDKVETLRLLDGVVDIYMPDFKFARAEVAAQYTQAEDYPAVARAAIREMHRQVGDLQMDEQGVAERGLLVRHLVLPDDLAGTREIMRFLSRDISPHTVVNIMDQYRPCGSAHRFPLLNRRISHSEYLEAVQIAREEGLWRFA